MHNYLIEFRFRGYAKKYLKRLIFEVSKKFRVKGVNKKRVNTHITLFGPFSTNNENKVITVFLNVVKKYELISFKLDSFGYFEDPSKVIYVNINPSEELKQLRLELAKNLIKLRSLILFKTVKTIGIGDYDNDFSFHSTIAFKDIEYKFNKIWNYLYKKRLPNINQYLLRVTLLKNRTILYEYDFIQKRLLNRMEAKDKQIWRKTIEILKARNLLS